MTPERTSSRVPWNLGAVFITFVLAVAIIGQLYYSRQQEHIKLEKQDYLSAIADMKVAEISEWRSERLSDGRTISKTPLLYEKIASLHSPAPSNDFTSQVETWLKSIQTNYGYESASLVDREGKVVIPASRGRALSPEDIPLFRQAISSSEILLSDLRLDSSGRNIHFDMAVPIVAPGSSARKVNAVVFLQINAERHFYPMVQAWPTPSRTSEVVLIEREGGDVLFLNDVRYRRGTALQFRLSERQLALPSLSVISEHEGILEGKDYRGVPVLAALRGIPDTRWELMVKTDLDELYAPIKERWTVVMIIMGVLIVAAASWITLLWRNQRSTLIQRHLELELKRKIIEEHFDALMRHANDGIIIIDMDGRILEANEKALRMYEYARDEFIGRNVRDTVAREFQQKVNERMSEVQERNGLVFESCHVRKDGSEFPVEVSSRVVSIDNKQFYQNIIRDITDRKLVEDRLREMENRFRSLIENAHDLILVTGPEGVITFVSPSVERILGNSSDGFCGRRFEEYVHPEEVEATRRVWQQALKNPGHAYGMEHRLNRGKGEWLNAETYVKFVPLGKGQGECIINSRDITERMQAHEELRLSEEKFSKAFLTSPDAICINRLNDGLFVEINDGFTTLTGYDKSDVIGRSSVEVNVWAVPSDRRRFVLELRRCGTLSDFETEFVLKDGSKRTALLSAKVLNVHNELWILSFARDITERKRAERYLLENEQRMRVALSGANIAVFSQTTDLTYTWMYNPQLGYSSTDVVGKTDGDLLPPGDAEKTIRLKRTAMQQGRGARAEVSVMRDGARSYYDLIVEPLKNEKGEVVGITGASLDITERKKAEEQLRLQKAYFQELFESAPEAIVLMKQDERIIDVNREFTRLFGYTRDEVFDRHINDLIVPLSRLDEGQDLTRRVADGSRISAESVRKRKDGTLVDVSILGCPVRVEGGEIGIYGIYRDISDRRQTEAALRSSESSFRGLFDSVNDAIYIQDRQGRFVDVNRGAVNMYGYPREYFVGKTPADLAAPGKNDLKKIAHLVTRAFDGEVQHFEFWGVRSNGEVFPKDVRVNKGLYFGEEVVIALAQDITERKRFEATLQETNRTLESLITASPLAITVVDPDGKIQLWNPAAEKIFGWKSEEVLGRFNPIVPKGRESEFLHLHGQALAGKAIHEIELQRQRKDGTAIEVSRSTALLRDTAGNVKGVMAVLADITERKRAVQRLRESEERLRLALTAADMMSWELDLTDGRVTWSEGSRKFFGMEAGEFHGDRESFVQLIHPEDRAVTEELMNEAIQQGGDFKSEFRVIWPDGSVHWHGAFGRALRDEKGQSLRMYGIGVDITERKKAEEVIQRLHQAVEQTDEVIFMTEPDGVITYVNPAFERLYRFTREEAVGRTPRILKSGGMSAEYYSLFWRDLLAGKSIRAEHINKSKNGKIIIVEASVNPIYDVKGRLSGFIAVQEDISDRKKNEQERRRLESQLMQTQKLESIGTLAGGIAHDFNNILGIILAYSASLRNPNFSREKAVNAADVINQAVERGAGLVKQILTFARKTDVVYGLVNINIMIKELKKMLSETFPRTVSIAIDLGSDVPDITADATQVHQAILNICVNARDAMPAGGKLTIRTMAGARAEVSSFFPEATSERYLHVTISDTGTGMDENTRQRIFEPFFTTKPKGKGTGLGLSVVYGVVKNHNGFVRVDSEIGKGTTFHLYFPVPLRSVETGEAVQRPLVDVPGGSECILLVEDETTLLDVLTGLLKSKGYRVLTARDGYEAVEMYKEHSSQIAVVVSDLGLPKMTGQDAFLRMKSIKPNVKVIFGTGYLDPELKTELLNLGARGFLSKPYRQEELLRRIRELIDVHE